MKIIQDLKAEFNKKIETLKITQVEMKMEQKSSVSQLENSGWTLTSESRGGLKSGLKDNEEDTDKISKEYFIIYV